MKTAFKILIAIPAVCAFAAPASAYTLTGTIPGHTRNLTAVHLQKPPSAGGILKLTLSAPPVNVGTSYVVNFCIALASLPASNPCAASSTTQAGLFIVPGRQTIVFVFANSYPDFVIWLGTGLSAAAPYTIDVDYIP
jgi:hypothetical protein